MTSSETKKLEFYDPRWFVWAIVFLLVTGMSLVTYIIVSDDGNSQEYHGVVPHRSISSASVQEVN